MYVDSTSVHRAWCQYVVGLIQAWIQVRKAPHYVPTIMTFLITLAKTHPAAEAVALNRLTRLLCLVTSLLYDNHVATSTNGSPATKVRLLRNF